jgi:guanylate kinase
MLEAVPELSYSISYTTRAPRSGEVNGREYFFVNRDTFEAMASRDEFLEWACVHGNLYGTAKKQVVQETSAGADIVLEVDVQGAASIRELMLDAVSIFILPPSYETLRQRLLARGTDSPEELAVRLKNAPEELRKFSCFDYVIINDDIDRAAHQIAAIISAERARCHRQEKLVKEVIENFKPV